jgi:outer membrane protein
MNFRSKIGVLSLALTSAVLGLAPSLGWASDIRLAYVDIQRALNECHNGKDVKVQFRGEIQHLQDRLQSEQDEVERLKKELEQKGTLMQPDERQNVEDEYTRKLHQFQDDYKNSRDDLQQKDNEMTGAIVRDLALVVEQIGQKSGYTMVMEKGSLLWAIPSIDITDEVIRAYDAMNVKPGALVQKVINENSGHFGSAAVPHGSAPRQAEPESDSEPASGGSTITK